MPTLRKNPSDETQLQWIDESGNVISTISDSGETVATTNLEAGLSGTAGYVKVYPATAASGFLRITCGDQAANHAVVVTTASCAATRTYTIPDAGASASFVMTEGAQTINGDKTYGGAQIRTGKKRVFTLAGSKVGGTAGFTVAAADNVMLATCPASQTGSKLVIPVTGLQVGDTITSFGLIGQVESAGGAVTVDCNLRSQTAAAADITDASVASMTQIAVSADTAINATHDKGSLTELVASDKVYYLLVTVTTAGSTDVALAGYSITVTTS